MSAKSIPLPASNLPRTGGPVSRRTTRPFWILALVVIAAVAVVIRAVSSGSAANFPAASPGIQLALGTLKLEGTDQAIDARQAATLLPLWQLLAQLNSSSSAAPEEVTAVVEEIKLNMTEAQISTIDAMPASDLNLGAAAGSPAAPPSRTSTGTNAVAGNPMLGGALGGAPMDGGGPMPSSSSQSKSSSKTTTTVTGPVQQVIDLLKSKVQS